MTPSDVKSLTTQTLDLEWSLSRGQSLYGILWGGSIRFSSTLSQSTQIRAEMCHVKEALRSQEEQSMSWQWFTLRAHGWVILSKG